MEEAETDLEIVQTDLIVTTIVIEVEEEIRIVTVMEIVQTVVEETLTAEPTTITVEIAEEAMIDLAIIPANEEVEMIAIVEERMTAATVEKIAIEAGMIVVVMKSIVMIVNAMVDRILAARGAIEDFGEKRLPRKNRPYHQQGWTSRWSV